MRFFHGGRVGESTPLTINLYFVRYDGNANIGRRAQGFIWPLGVKLNPGELKVDSTPLVLEEGDAVLGDASLPNLVQYVISGVEQEV